MNRLLYLRILFVCTAITSTALGQGLRLSGYYENQFFPQEIAGKLIFQDYNKIRIDLSSDISKNLSFNGNYNYRTFHGKTQFNALDFIPQVVVDRFSAETGISINALRSYLSVEQNDENFLDNAFVTIYSKHFTLRIGKQQLPWGTGYTWNPTDIFNDKNTLDPMYEKVGVNAFKIEIPFGASSYLSGILSVDENWSRSTKAFKAKTHLSGFDLSITFAEKSQQVSPISLNGDFTEKRRMLGADASGELLGLGVWGEAAHNFMDDTHNYSQYLFGADYTFEGGLYIISEYYHNELGKRDKNNYALADWVRLLSADAENLGQDYLFGGQMYPIAELWTWSNYALISLNDWSGIIFPWFEYSLNDNTELIFVGYVPFGSTASEFGEFGKGGFARIRVYF